VHGLLLILGDVLHDLEPALIFAFDDTNFNTRLLRLVLSQLILELNKCLKLGINLVEKSGMNLGLDAVHHLLGSI
jgi:hypothetical protein